MIMCPIELGQRRRTSPVESGAARCRESSVIEDAEKRPLRGGGQGRRGGVVRSNSEPGERSRFACVIRNADGQSQGDRRRPRFSERRIGEPRPYAARTAIEVQARREPHDFRDASRGGNGRPIGAKLRSAQPGASRRLTDRPQPRNGCDEANDQCARSASSAKHIKAYT